MGGSQTIARLDMIGRLTGPACLEACYRLPPIPTAVRAAGCWLIDGTAEAGQIRNDPSLAAAKRLLISGQFTTFHHAAR